MLHGVETDQNAVAQEEGQPQEHVAGGGGAVEVERHQPDWKDNGR